MNERNTFLKYIPRVGIALMMIGIFAIFLIQKQKISNDIYQNDLQISDENKHLKKQKNGITFLSFGDYGFESAEAQVIVSQKINKIAKDKQADFIIGLGDNFYKPDGVTGINDPNWKYHWVDVYQTQDYLQNLKWYGVLGNHDYNAKGVYAQFYYDRYGWVMEDFFYTHTHQLGDQKVSFVHMDTNYLAYGRDGDRTYSLMREWFENLEIQSDQDILDKILEQFEKVKDSDWIIGVGHHYVGGNCIPTRSTGKIYDILLRYNVTAYFHGHKHSLAFGYQNGIGFYLSGAAGINRGKCVATFRENQLWAMGHVFGFVEVNINGDSMSSVFHYTKDLLTWQKYKTIDIQRRIILP